MTDRDASLCLTRWTPAELQKFLEIRQEFFLDPMGSNKERFLEASIVLQRALFDWYLTPPKQFEGMIALVRAAATKWSELRQEERRTLWLRRFALNNAASEIPSVESSVPEDQWQKIFGSLGLGLKDPGTFDRFLAQLDEETNPSLHVNHRYLGELLPHDNMISYLSSITATFLNENAIIGKVSPCVTHMEQAAVRWLLALVGWDGDICAAKDSDTVPSQRLPTLAAPAQRHLRWEREEPTGTIVAGGTIANISAFLIARSAVFDYLLGWDGAVRWLGPMLAWELVKKIWKYKRLVVLTSKGAHYSIHKAALQAGIAPGDVIDIAGSRNPWVLDGEALACELKKHSQGHDDLILAVAAIAGKTESGSVDKLEEIATVLNQEENCLWSLEKVFNTLQDKRSVVDSYIGRLCKPEPAASAFAAARTAWEAKDGDLQMIIDRIKHGNEIERARHNRLFFHVDAAHGGAYLTVLALRQGTFRGIESADTITIDGHKSFYCYYPCGGLLIRTTRWAQTFSVGHSAYISEEENRGAYWEGLMFARALESDPRQRLRVGSYFDGDSQYEGDAGVPDEQDLDSLDAVYQLTGRPTPRNRSELTHQPFLQYLEGSRGPQGIMQLYFNLATLGLCGYQSILGWTALLRARTEEAISLGMSDLRLVTDEPLPAELRANDKQAAIQSASSLGLGFEALRPSAGATVVPTSGGRFFRLSDGECNQLLISYVPAREAKLIATASFEYWQEREGERVNRVMRYLWRINEHLWNEHTYANPQFTYYLGHTPLELELPANGPDRLAELLTKWNAWTRQREHINPFFLSLAKYIEKELVGGSTLPKGKNAHSMMMSCTKKFFCHKVVLMHPYTDESLVGDMLRRLAFWGERSVIDVRRADATAQFLFPSAP